MVRKNPFVHRGPITDPTYFCGRDRETRLALRKLSNGESVEIIGPRRIGKTSLLFHIKNPDVFEKYGLSPERFCFVYADCEGRGDDRQNEILGFLIKELKGTLNITNHLIEKSFNSISGPITRQNFREVIEDITGQGINLIFMLDEFDDLSANSHLDKNFFSYLRGLAIAPNIQITFITASTQPLINLTYKKSSVLASPFFNIFTPIHLHLFRRMGAEKLLSTLAALEEITFSPQTIDFLIDDLAGTHPFFLQIAGEYAFDLRVDADASLDETRRKTVESRFKAEANRHWTFTWEHLSDPDKRVLALLSDAFQPTDTIGQYENLGLVIQGDDNRYKHLSRAFQEFVGRQTVPELLQVFPVTLDVDRRISLRRGKSMSLPPKEFDLLAYLMEKAGEVISHQDLISKIWPDESSHPTVQAARSDDRLRTIMRNLRRALTEEDKDCIENIYEKGYTFVGK